MEEESQTSNNIVLDGTGSKGKETATPRSEGGLEMAHSGRRQELFLLLFVVTTATTGSPLIGARERA